MYFKNTDEFSLIKEKKPQQSTYMIKNHLYSCEFIVKTGFKIIKIRYLKPFKN
jgi:hypothetical protein